MKPSSAVPTLAVCALLAAAQPLAAQPACQGQNTLSAAEKSAGWLLLFDGTSTKGWHGYNGQKTPGLVDRGLRAPDRRHRGQLRQRPARRPRHRQASTRTSS